MIPDEYLTNLRERLNNRAEDVCRHILPAGRREGNGWRCGGVDGSEGKSLEVELSGPKVGVFNDRASDDKGGNLLTLWMNVRGLSFREAVDDAAEFCGMQPRPKLKRGNAKIVPSEFHSSAPKATSKNRPDPVEAEVVNDDAMPTFTQPPPVDWDDCLMSFTPEKAEELAKWRGYSIEFVNWLHEQEMIGIYKGNYAFPVHDAGGKVARIHYRLDKGWAYHPKGVTENGPLIVGTSPLHAAHVLMFESQWDAFAILDKLKAHASENVGIYCAYITRGATSNTNLSKLPISEIIACPQNDPKEKASKSTGRTPAQEWLFRIRKTKHKTSSLLVFDTPENYEDANDWICGESPDHYHVFKMVIKDSAPSAECDDETPPDQEWDSTEFGSMPKKTFPVPSGGVGFTDSARHIFPTIAKSHRLLIRGNLVHEVAQGKGEADYLVPVSPERFCNLVESFGYKVKRREIDENKGTVTWRKTTFPISSAKILLASDVAAECLPPIRQLAACSIITKDGSIIGRGYHDHAGGTFITAGDMPPNVPLEAAKTALMGLLEDFNFVTPSDKSRGMASILSPALKMGGWVDDDYPLDVAEANKSQSGKTYRQKLVVRIYNEIPSAITAPRGGVGSLDESISAALIKGRPFIALDNFRGLLDSTILEQSIRGMNRVTCRALRTSADVDTQPFNWQLSTNGAEFTRDIANRSIITRIRKQPDDYAFRCHPEGDLLAHVAANQSFYLGAVFAVIREWSRHGCQRTQEHRHDFRGWCQRLDWIVQNVFGLAPLLDGHREEQARTSNPALQWLREITMAAQSAHRMDRQLSTSELVGIADDAGIEFPGNSKSLDGPNQRAGKILGKLFREAEDKPIHVDGFTVLREIVVIYTDRGGESQKFYTIRGN